MQVKLNRKLQRKAILASFEQVKKTQEQLVEHQKLIIRQLNSWSAVLQQTVAAIQVLQKKGFLNDKEITDRYKSMLEEGKRIAERRNLQSQGKRTTEVRSGDSEPGVLRIPSDNPDSGSKRSENGNPETPSDSGNSNSDGAEPTRQPETKPESRDTEVPSKDDAGDSVTSPG